MLYINCVGLLFFFLLDCAVYGCLPPTGPRAAEESSSCDLIYSSATKEAESKMLFPDPSKETPSSCSLIEEQGNPLAKQEQEGNWNHMHSNICNI